MEVQENVSKHIKKKITDKGNSNFTLKKRAINKRPVDGDNVIFVTKKTTFKNQLNKCCELLASGVNEVILHGLGACVVRCCNLALQLQRIYSGNCEIEVNTGTSDAIDDLEPVNDDFDFDTQIRQISSVHIRVFRLFNVTN